MKNIKFRRAHFFDEKKTKFSNFTEWGVGHDSFTSPAHTNYAMYFIDCQLTDLKDKNEKEIYEYNILKIDGIVFKDKQPRSAVMVWDKYCHGWRMDVDAEKKVKENHLEIIGNFFENKELLK